MSETVSDGSVVARPGRIFTPNIPAEARYLGERLNDGRAVMWLDPGDVDKVAGWRKGQWVEVTDQNTGTRWRATPAPCGADCYCAAFAEPIASEEHRLSLAVVDDGEERWFRAVCSCGWDSVCERTNAVMGRGRRHVAAARRRERGSS